MTATNICSNFGGKWDSSPPPPPPPPLFLMAAELVINIEKEEYSL